MAVAKMTMHKGFLNLCTADLILMFLILTIYRSNSISAEKKLSLRQYVQFQLKMSKRL